MPGRSTGLGMEDDDRAGIDKQHIPLARERERILFLVVDPGGFQMIKTGPADAFAAADKILNVNDSGGK